ncbi:hypothetical protein QYF61_024913 [Mycteria americana]|uniref:Contactin-associated protein-like 5 n=1 Tax=Mycteria americana TaxID=33587 RepID=A0AAN7RRW9_MYCAM|nr:hypothetical protein QYF61_024913 [Mycteria americana]
MSSQSPGSGSPASFRLVSILGMTPYAIYEQSCEAYRHQGKMSGFFYIDSDGSGPLGPLRVFCNITEDKIWTAVQHNNTGLTRVQGADPEKPYTMSFNYNSSAEQLEAMINSAEYCEQEAAYHCKKSRLLNTPRQFWNAASFNTEASYLHFPTLHAEVSADISFFFKTTAVSGVFLENLGIKDFIRVEISSPKEITFSIDVGNGPTEATVQSPTPLNDNQWHYVRAERNLKQTSLQVDSLPKKVLEAPAEGHFRLQLNSQLFVGSLQVRYKLSKDGLLIFTIDSGNFANRELHHVKINREGRELVIQVDQVLKLKHNFSEIDFKAIRSLTLGKVTDSLSLDPEVSKANAYGFTGCLSSVQYNHIAPLKSALRHPSVAPVTVKGPLTESSCASIMEADVNTIAPVLQISKENINVTQIPYPSGDEAIGVINKQVEFVPTLAEMNKNSLYKPLNTCVIAVVIFIIFCIIAIMSRFLYQHKQAHRSSQTKEKEYPENLESSFKADIDLQNTVSECKREYFI